MRKVIGFAAFIFFMAILAQPASAQPRDCYLDGYWYPHGTTYRRVCLHRR